MDTQLKQRLVGLTVIFSVAVIFLPMLLDGSGISRDPAPDSSIPPKPEIEAGLPVKELVMELDKKTEELVRLEPVIVDEISDPPVKAGSDTKQLSPAVDTKQATPAKTDAQKSEQPQKATVVNKAESKAAQKPPQKVASKPVATEKAVKPHRSGEQRVMPPALPDEPRLNQPAPEGRSPPPALTRYALAKTAQPVR